MANSGKITGRAKHRQAYGTHAVSRLVKLALERETNKPKPKRPKEETFDTPAELFDEERRRKR